MSMHDDGTQQVVQQNNLIQFPNSNFFSLNEVTHIENDNKTLFDNTNISKIFNGPISGDMWKKIKALNSKYPDNFDWSIYDQIYNRFGDNQPRGSVVFKTTFKLVNYHTSCSKCHHAFEIDSYGRGCIHNCVFCYAKDQLTSHGFWNRPVPFPVDLSEVRKIMHTIFETDRPSKWRAVMDAKVPLRIGSMSDSFMGMDKKYGVTKELIKILNYYQYPHIIFTRSDLAADDEYLSIFNKDLVSIQYSISGNNERYTRLVEPGAPSYKRRLAALKKIAEAGFWTTVRLNPFFPMYPDGYFTDEKSIVERFGSKANVPKFDYFDWSMLDELKEAKVPSILAGVVRLSSKAINNMSEATKLDIRSFFKPELLAGQGDKKYSDREIQHYYFQLAKEAQKRDIRFNTCYIGNGEKDYYQYQNLWSNKKDCCDAVGNVKGFTKTSQSINWEERTKHASCKVTAAKSQEQEQEMSKMYKALPSNNSIEQPYEI